MKVKVVKAFADKKQSYYKGDTAIITKELGKKVIDKGFAIEIKDEEELREIKVDKPKETKKAKKKTTKKK